MAITAADVLLIAPELEAVPSATVDVFLVDAKTLVSATAWGDLYEVALKYTAAHLLAQAGYGSSGGRGDVTGMSVGGVSISYASGASSKDGGAGLSGTRFGKFLIQLRRQHGLHFAVV